LDAIPMVLMYRAQYRNFATSQNIVCMHTVDVDATNHAGIRWYELENTAGTWSVRQQGTYAPDSHSRWMGSIAMNAQHAIALGYTVSSSSVYPSIRYCGQSPAVNATASGVLDIAEDVIQAGTASQTAYNRWGDYSFMAVDPVDNNTFWYTSEYIGSGGSRQTRIAAFELTDAPLTADFYADITDVCSGGTVNFQDLSLGSPISWSWSFPGGSPSSSSLQNPTVTYNTPGTYNVSLSVSDGSGTNDIVKTNYITVQNVIADFVPSSLTVAEGSTLTFSDNSSCFPTTWNWTFNGGTPASYSGPNPPPITYNTLGTFDVTLEVIKGSYSDTKVIPIEVIPLSYCTPTYSTGTGAGDYISLVQLGDINNATGASSSPYYTYYSSLSTDLTQDDNYTITLSPGTYGSGNYIAVWIDYNRDGTFNQTTERLGTILIAPTPATGTINFTVPADANVGTTRMRVREVWNNSNFDACTQYSYGETEDYNVNILGTDIRLDLTAFLEGPFNGTNMNANIVQLLPLSQPFNTTPWNYTGTESVGTIPNPNVVEWVLVDVRDAASVATATSSTSISKQAAFILNDGSIVGLDGSSNLIFNVSISQNLFVVVWQRNHLGIISNDPLASTGGIYSYDFTTGINQVFGGIDGHKQISIGIWGMIGGDGNHDGQVNINDKSPIWEGEAGEKGYLFGDHNLDGESNNQDKDDIWVPNEGKSSQVPN
ncbi:MAG: PKD domain-containing protein, partial [Bacteroidales bacterium]|nr:PKD domain-containing protein [Bacteroidales bacterium]